MAPDDAVLKRTNPGCIIAALDQMEKDELAETKDILGSLSMKALEDRELAMLNLTTLGISTGLGGRTMIEVGTDPAVTKPGYVWNPIFSVGDIVSLNEQPRKEGASRRKNCKDDKDKEDNSLRCVVYKAGRESLTIAAEDADSYSVPGGRVWLLKLADTSVYKRMHWAAQKFNAGESLGPVAHLMRGEAQAIVKRGMDMSEPFLSANELNASQKEAISYAVGSNLCVIHGPPGTGKTSTLVEIICQLVSRGEKVLVCGASNISVDNIVERLANVEGVFRRPQEVLRLGHPSRLSGGVLRHSFDLLSRGSDDGQILRDLQEEISETLAFALRRPGKKLSGALPKTRGEAFKLLKELRKDYRARESKLMDLMLRNAKVVAATLHGAGSKDLGAVTPLFSTIIIDEVSQALLPQCWIPAVIDTQAARLIVAGDNKQLPPTIKSTDKSVQELLETTLFDALLAFHGEDIKHLISVQYRMSQKIMAFPSTAMYEGKLTAHASVERQRLTDLTGVERNDLTEASVYWIDTMNGLWPESKHEEDVSIKNEGEADIVATTLNILVSAGVKPEDIGVIAPYNAQVALIRHLLSDKMPDVEISTVDGFQGREKEVIILSMVRSNDTPGNVGFVSDSRRINVAITRPRSLLCIVGNSETLGGIPQDKASILPSWVDWCAENADIEYAD